MKTVKRPALLELLEAGSDTQITAVIAAAGTGKTFVIRSWLATRQRTEPVAWVAVIRGERDAQRFWSSVANAVSGAITLDQQVEATGAAPALDPHAVIARLIEKLGALQTGLTIVFDDLHEIKSRNILGQLTQFFDNLPGTVRVVVISRHDLQIGLHRRRLNGDLTEIRIDQLRFTIEETRALLAAAGITVSESGLHLLQDRTEGWVAGLRLAVLALEAHADPERFVREFSGSERTVSEYLIAEVLERQTPEVRRLLVRTSILDRVNGALGDLLTGSTGSEGYLGALAEEGSFVIQLDANGEWFRFHHLFTDLLAAELRHSEASAIFGLHTAAAEWYSNNGYVLEAIRHALAADDRERVATLLVEHYLSLMLDGRQATARELLDAAVAQSDSPELAVLLAADELIAGSLDSAAAHLALAEQSRSEITEDRQERFDMMLYLCRLTFARRVGDFHSVPHLAQPKRISAKPHSEKELSTQVDLRAWLLMNRGIVEVWSGRLDEGEGHLLEAGEIARQAGRPYLLASCLAHRAQAISWRSFTQALPVAREALTIAEAGGLQDDPVAGVAHLVEGICLVAAGRLGLAEQAFSRADQTLRSDLEPAVGLMLQTGHGVINLLSGRYPEAIDSFLEAERLGESLAVSAPLALQAKCAAVYAAVLGGNDRLVQAKLGEFTEAECNTGEVREVLAARAITEVNPAGAITTLEPILDGTTPMHHGMVLIRSLLLDAKARYLLGDDVNARTSVERALDLAEVDGLIDPFLWVPSGDLLERHHRHRTAHGAFLTMIQDALSGRQERSEPGRRGASPVVLSDTELRILRYLPSNLTAAEIAAEVSLSVNTIKTHMQSIYVKLDAHSRSQAVGCARDLGLLGGTTLSR